MLGNVQFSSHPLVHKIVDKNLIKLIFKISKRFNRRRQKLLNERQVLKAKRFIPEMQDSALTEQWRVADIPERLQQRRVEVLAPAYHSKLIIQMMMENELGDYADSAVIDFEDSMKPSFENVLLGYLNCIGVLRGSLEVYDGGRNYKIQSDNVYPMIKVRGLHLDESNITVDDEPCSASLMDLAITAYLTCHEYRRRGLHPKFIIPKIETSQESRYWNDVLCFLEEELKLKSGEIKATLLIETYPAVCAATEILDEFRERAVALKIDLRDRLFSDIKIFSKSKEHILKDQTHLDLENYAKQIIKISHQHQALALAELMTASASDEEVRHQQNHQIFLDCEIRSAWGFDGCSVADPYFITSARRAFPHPQQLKVMLEKFNEFASSPFSGEGPYSFLTLRENVKRVMTFLYFWRKDIGCFCLEDSLVSLADFECSRAQVWQWKYHHVHLDNLKRVDTAYLRELFDEVEQDLLSQLKDAFALKTASDWGFELVTEEKLRDFLVTENPIYDESEESHHRTQIPLAAARLL